MSNQDQEMLQKHVNSIAKTLSEGFGDELNNDDEPMSAFDYLQDALDINWILNNDRTYRGARVLVAFGGPNIWVDTNTGLVEGYWWGDYAKASFDDNIGLDDALSELFNC
mgnify:CR=1 FL=1